MSLLANGSVYVYDSGARLAIILTILHIRGILRGLSESIASSRYQLRPVLWRSCAMYVDQLMLCKTWIASDLLLLLQRSKSLLSRIVKLQHSMCNTQSSQYYITQVQTQTLDSHDARMNAKNILIFGCSYIFLVYVGVYRRLQIALAV